REQGLDAPQEFLRKAGQRDRFRYEGKSFQSHAVGAVPKPYQKPPPPLRVAATSEESYAAVGRRGLPIFLAVRTSSISELERYVGAYHAAWRAAGHPGRGEVAAILPVYVPETERLARAESGASARHFFRAVGEGLRKGAGHASGERLRHLTYGEVLTDFTVYGTAERVADRIEELRDVIGFTKLAVWMNVGSRVPHERVLASMRRFAD